MASVVVPTFRISEQSFDCDVLVVGGGINGAASRATPAGRGLRVVLCEKDDLAQHTSSASSKLIHGGLRYLEHYEFGLVRKALIEREVLLRSAPHIMRPLRFVMPHDAGQRPAWLIRAGLFLYDHLARREFLPGSQAHRPALPPGRRAAASRSSRAASCIPTAGSTTRAWWCSMRSTPASAAPPSSPAPAAAPAAPAQRLDATLDGHGDGGMHVKARCLVNAAGPGRRASCTARTAGAARAAAPDQGQPHRGAAPVRARPRLHLPASGRAHRVRHSLRGATSR
jgi:glycerol-3-phosphate dehydrogenase